MSRAGAYFGSRRVPQFAVLALISFGVAGCSGDMSSRLSNPFNYQGDATGAVPQATPRPKSKAKPKVRPRSSPRSGRAPRPSAIFPPGDQSSSLPPPAVVAPHSYPVASSGVSGGGRGLASYAPSTAYATPPAQPKLETTASVPPRSVAAARPHGRHHHHRRHQRHAGSAGAALSRHAGCDPCRQRLQGPAYAVAGPIPDHSASGSGCGGSGSHGGRRLRLPHPQAGRSRPWFPRRAFTSSIPARRWQASPAAIT